MLEDTANSCYLEAMLAGSLAYDSFRSLPQSMNTLLLAGALPDQSSLVEDAGATHFLLYPLMLLYMLLASLTVMNMLVAGSWKLNSGLVLRKATEADHCLSEPKKFFWLNRCGLVWEEGSSKERCKHALTKLRAKRLESVLGAIDPLRSL